MKHLLLLSLSTFFLVGCTTTFQHNGHESREFTTHIYTQEQFADIWNRDFREEEFHRLSNKFDFDENNLSDTRHVMPSRSDLLYGVGSDVVEYNENINDIFTSDDHTYTLSGDNIGDHIFEIYKDNKILFAHQMIFGASSAIEEAGILTFNTDNKASQNKEFFTFYDYITDDNGKILNQDRRNIWFDGQTINDIYNLDNSSFPFSYNNKLGFVAGKDGKKFIIYNGVQVSEFYDDILTFSCCAVMHYPLRIDTNGNFLFLAKKGKKYVFVEVKL